MKIFSYLNQGALKGDQIGLLRTGPAHMGAAKLSKSAQDVSRGPFADLVFGALNKVSNSQLLASEQEQQSLLNPDSVDVHEVTIAMAKANMALGITKAVLDRSVQAYKEIINLR